MKVKSNKNNSDYKRKNIIHEHKSPIKSYEELTLMDSFLFESVTETTENAMAISKIIIERATGRKVGKLLVEAQKELKGINVTNHGIRMDVYTTELDEMVEGNRSTCVYDIEPNNYYEKDIPHRNRYYQSLIDSKLLPISEAYDNIPDLLSIWILPYDPFGDDRMIYTVKNMVVENNQIVYNDGVAKLFLYTRGTKGGSQKLRELLAFMENPICDNAVDEELSKILNIVDAVKSNPEEKRRYMGIMGVIDYEKRNAYENGRAVGYQSGLQEGQIQGSIEFCKFKKTDRETTKADIMLQFSLEEKDAEEYMKKYWDVPIDENNKE